MIYIPIFLCFLAGCYLAGLFIAPFIDEGNTPSGGAGSYHLYLIMLGFLPMLMLVGFVS